MANYTDYTFRLIELRDGVDSAIHNIKNVIAQQEKLNGIIEAHEDSEEFTLFLDESQKQIENYKNQLLVLNGRLEMLNNSITAIEAASEETKEVVFNLFESLGIFNKEEKTKENE